MGRGENEEVERGWLGRGREDGERGERGGGGRVVGEEVDRQVEEDGLMARGSSGGGGGVVWELERGGLGSWRAWWWRSGSWGSVRVRG